MTSDGRSFDLMSPVIRYSPGRYLGYPLSLQLRPPAVAGSAEHASARHRASTPDAPAAVGMRAVQTALAANGAITLAKLGAFLGTGSGTMLAETLHSLGDTVNQSLVAYGVWRASKVSPSECLLFALCLPSQYPLFAL